MFLGGKEKEMYGAGIPPGRYRAGRVADYFLQDKGPRVSLLSLEYLGLEKRTREVPYS